jgi:toxin YhaV
MKPFDANGWTVLFYTDFQLQWEDLAAKVVKLKSKLEPKDFVIHPDVKLLKAIDSGIGDKISVDPFASHFALRKPLDRYGRLPRP